MPTAFGYSYIVPIPKGTVGNNRPLNCEDFRGIAISSIISKWFEYCFLHKLGDFCIAAAIMLDSKKGLGCNHVIYTVRKIVDRLIQDAQLSQRDRAAGCVIVFPESRTLELGDKDLRTL